MPKLVVEKGADKSNELILGKTIFAGRDTSAHLILSEPMISRLHFKIEHRADGYYIVDLGSLNGTFVNRARVKERLLKYGDMIQVGDTLMSYISDEPDKEPRNMIGKSVGGYTVIEKVGRGGMGTVYRANQISLNRVVALKILSEEMVKDKTFIEMFLQEARSAAQLNHNNIVQVYDSGKADENTYYFSMEFMAGGSIQELLMKKSRLAPFTATKKILDAAQGLQYAEKKGIVHRDIKPDNLMLGEDEIVKIGDLGLAKSMYSPTEPSGNLMGTPHYLAPEQAQLNKTVDHRADIYSLGASFYRILTGMTPYSANSVKDLIQKKIKEDPKPLKKVMPNLPDSLAGVVDKMMKRKVEERYQNSTELISDLQKVKDELDPNRPPITVADDSHRGKTGQAGRKSTLKKIILAILLIGLILLAVYLIVKNFRRENQNAPPPVSGNQGGNTDMYKAKLAEQYFNEAEAYRNSKVNIDDKNTIIQGITKYERIISDCQGTKFVSRAKIEIDHLNELYKQAEAKEEHQALEKQNLVLYDKLEAEINEQFKAMQKKSDIEPVKDFIRQLNIKLDEFNQQYGISPAISGKVTKKETEINQWYIHFQGTGPKYQELKKQVENFISSGQFSSAFELVLKFVENPDNQNTIYDNIAKGSNQDIEAAAQKSFAELMQQVDDLIKNGMLIEAQDLMTKALGSYGVEDIEKRIKDKLAWFNSQRGIMQKDLLAKESTMYTETFVTLLCLLQKGQFDELDKRKQSASGQFKTSEYSGKLSELNAAIDSEENILKRLIAKFNRRETGSSQLQGKEVVSIDNGVIKWKDEPIKLTFHELSALDWAVCISGGWNLTAKEYFDLGVLCLKRGGLDKKAVEYFTEAVNKSTDKDLKSAARKYKTQLSTQLAKFQKDREDEFAQIREESERLLAGKKYQPALDGFTLLKYRYWDTSSYKRDPAVIEKRIDECEKAMAESNPK